MEYTISIENVVVWLVIYFIMCGILPTILDITIWRTFGTKISTWLNLLTLIVFNSLFIFYLTNKYKLKISIFSNITLKGILLAIGCSVLFFILLDKFLDTFFDSVFTTSAEGYQKTIASLRQFPIANFIRICLLAPIVEEILMRGYILSSLQNKYGTVIALLVSSLLFAILHFNFVQTLSAVVCGLILGLLYISTGSLFCCILAHSLYNAISFFACVLE
ncbi:type II CAAX endopeptidase family protein [Proteiniborus sp. MB09-C3]|uniref:CPBP family intramembrane glutamic endopeptidase n=1 Tax=Proteiniborus sp. MB09-C3 TaxID=3050072 RepID=UPI0025568DDF|nr:type II CAAX endopeptidase family protein [Proteiniborus sp. MB09-C3]WIV11579.1 type II CAAX endopeptidase family protein [Proteiniborus sp. MB09-C3]